VTRSALGSVSLHDARPNSEAIIAGGFGLEVIGIRLGVESLEKDKLRVSSSHQSWKKKPR